MAARFSHRDKVQFCAGSAETYVMGGRSVCLIVGTLWLLVGCTKGQPTFTTLSSDNIPQPLFSGLTSESITASTTTTTLSIRGECDGKISGLTAFPVGTGVTSEDIANLASSVQIDCSTDGHFSFTLKSLTDLGFSNLTAGGVYTIDLQAVTSSGVSKASTIVIHYLTDGDGSSVVRMAAGAEANAKSSSYAAAIRVTHNSNNVKTSTHYHMVFGVGETTY